MSAKATFWAWEQRGINATCKLVLLCLADCHNKDTHRCDPSVSFIAANTGLDRKTVMKCIAMLEESGRIQVKKRPGARTNYALNIVDAVRATSTEIGTGTEIGTSTKNGTATSTKIGTTPVPKLGHEPISNLKETYKNIYKGLSLDSLPEEISPETAKEFIDHRNNLKKPLTQKALDRTITKAVKAATDPEVNYSPTEIIEKIIDSGWQSFEIHYLKNKKTNHQPAPRPASAREMPIAGSEK